MRLFLVGFGVVGQAFVKLLHERGAELYRDHAITPRLVGVADSKGAAVSENGLDAEALLAAKRQHGGVAAMRHHAVSHHDIPSLIRDSDADVVIEAAPTRIDAPAASVANVKAAFASGMHVITVNKAPLAVAMPALMELADYNRVQFRFSGTVGGGTPILAWAKHCAVGDEIVRVRAILNGTTNFILSTMHETDASFADALAEAVRLGFAETDPSADIDAVDPAVKTVIFANWVLNRRATLADVKITGIRDIPRDRIDAAAADGRVVKLIAEIGDALTVEPQAIPKDAPLNVPANLNAVTLTLRSSGDVTLIGKGAGGDATAVAILRDLLDVWQRVSSPSIGDLRHVKQA